MNRDDVHDPENVSGSIIAVVEPNATVRKRIARVLNAVMDGDRILPFENGTDPELIAANPTLIVCNASELGTVLAMVREHLPFSHVVTWTARDSATLFATAHEQARLSHVIGWPAFLSTPRPWEVVLATRRLGDPRVAAPELEELLGWGARTKEWTPATSDDRDRVVDEAKDLAERMTGSARMAERVGVVLHELLMNAMYDAPVDRRGERMFAGDRKRTIALEPPQAPRARLASDGLLLAVQVTDPFGTLRREPIFSGVARGIRGAGKHAQAHHVIDTSHGGAGLGLFTIFGAATVTIYDLDPGRKTEVTAIFDLDLPARDQRTMPKSLHVFER